MFSDSVRGSNLLNILLGTSNCLLGCGLGFYYGKFSFDSVLLALTILATSVGICLLCNFSVSYASAYNRYRKSKHKGIIIPLMVGSTSITVVRKTMAIITLITSILGFTAIVMAVGSDIQSVSWFAFMVTIAVILSVLFTAANSYYNNFIVSAGVFLFLGSMFVSGSQLLIIYKSVESFDIYPDSILLSIACGIVSVVVLQFHTVKALKSDISKGKKNLSLLFSYSISKVILVVVVSMALIFSCIACFKSHQAWEICLLMLTMIPILYSLFMFLQHDIKGITESANSTFFTVSFICHNLMWLAVLFTDYLMYS